MGRIEWDGRQAITATLPVAPGVLVAANNVLSLHLPGVGSVVEGMWLDGFALRYARGNVPAGSSVLFTGDGEPRMYSLGLTSTVGLRGYDVTVPNNPISLLGIVPARIIVTDPVSGGAHRYLLTSAVVIQPPADMRLATELQPLCIGLRGHRSESRGLRLNALKDRHTYLCRKAWRQLCRNFLEHGRHRRQYVLNARLEARAHGRVGREQARPR